MSAYKDASEVPWNSLAEGFGRNGIDVKKHWQTIEARAGKKIKQMKVCLVSLVFNLFRLLAWAILLPDCFQSLNLLSLSGLIRLGQLKG
jgi:hypothetical protein